jgi:hypothetical protein
LKGKEDHTKRQKDKYANIQTDKKTQIQLLFTSTKPANVLATSVTGVGRYTNRQIDIKLAIVYKKATHLLKTYIPGVGGSTTALQQRRTGSRVLVTPKRKCSFSSFSECRLVTKTIPKLT